MATIIGADGVACSRPCMPRKPRRTYARLLSQVQILRKVWVQQFHAPARGWSYCGGGKWMIYHLPGS